MSEEESQKSNTQAQVEGRWDKQEHKRFITALMAHGKNWKMIQNTVQTRNTSQVRSHAQKFFLKLLKIEKQRKKNMKKGIFHTSKVQEQLRQCLSQQPITSNTPQQILHFLQKESKITAQISPPSKNLNFEKEAIKSRTHLILQQVMGHSEQDSFLVSLIKHNFNFFQRDEAIADLIDFPDVNRQEKQDEQTANKRKKSFLLYDQQEDEVKYNEMIKKMNGCRKI